MPLSENAKARILNAGLWLFVLAGSIAFLATLLLLAIICVLAAVAIGGAGEAGLATIPGVAGVVLGACCPMFVLLPVYCLFAGDTSAADTAPSIDDKLGRGAMAIFGGCVGSLVGAIGGVLVAVAWVGWPGGLLFLGVSISMFAAIGYFSPDWGGEFLTQVFELICDGIISVGKIFE